MANLTAKHQAFVNMMTESDELARRGFDLLSKRGDLAQFFDALNEAGFFAPSKNPAPAPAEQEGYVRIPYWSPLDYLVAVAKRAGEGNDSELAGKVMNIVRDVSSWQDLDHRRRENYHTTRKFAEILGLVPTQAITLDDINLIQAWLEDRFDRGMVAHALDEGALPRLIKSGSTEDWDKAVEIVRHCTAIRWQRANESDDVAKKPVSAVDDYWLKEMLGHHVVPLAVKRGRKLAELFSERVREVFSSEGRREYGHIYRPAVEDHSQNHDWHGAENRPVEGLRDTLVSWCGTGDPDGMAFVQSLLDDEFVIVRRIGIFVISKCWAQLNTLYERLVDPKFFDLDYLHELYNLLKDHFGELSEQLQQRTVDAIQQIPSPDWSDEPARTLKLIQQRWLSAIVGKGHRPGDEWFAALQAEVGPIPEHPDFLSYSEVRVGPGPSVYSVQDVLAFLQQGALVDKLNSFEAESIWNGPTLDGLLSTVEEAVKSDPSLFLRKLPQFLAAKTPYQHAVISGLKQAWENVSSPTTQPDWDRAWPDLVTFFETLIGPDEFWHEVVAPRQPMVPTRNWVASSVADFLRSGTRKDEHAYPSALFPRTRALVEILLMKTAPVEKPSDDAMTQAINSPRGKSIEALISQALMECRAADRAANSHGEPWATFQPLFDAELEKCQDTNFEFSTLVGAYLSQFRYMDTDWVNENIPRMFPAAYPRNSACAVDGLAYAPFARQIYRDLVQHGAIDRALHYELKGRVAREKLLERIAVAYLWGEDDLDSDRFAHLFRPDGGDDLVTITHLFWSIRRGDLPEEQRKRVVKFWERCIGWSREVGVSPEKLLSTLATLTPFLNSADGYERELLEAVAPHVHIGYNAHEFVEDLSRLVDVSPDGVNAVLDKVIAARVPDYDYQDRLKSLLERLVEKGKRDDVILYAERLRNLSGIQEFYERLRANL
jgi:hypothetical protein